MTDDDRSPPSALRGRLADVYVPALAAGAVVALSRRLGNRATVDDPLYGRASTIGSIDPLLARVAAFFAEGGATYAHICSTTGVDRDAAEGRLVMTIDGKVCKLPIAIVAERRRLREIELRVYYSPVGAPSDRKSRPPLVSPSPTNGLAEPVEAVIEALRDGAVDEVLAGFEATARIVHPSGGNYEKVGGAMAAFLSDLGAVNIEIGGFADDGRAACVEATLTRYGHEPVPALFAFERGDSGLMRELRLYWG